MNKPMMGLVLIGLVLALSAGCASPPRSVPVEERGATPPEQEDAQGIPETGPGTASPVPSAPATQHKPSVPPTAATLALVQDADRHAQAGRYAAAAASLERALRIDPGNAELWQRLAAVRLQQGQYLQAEQLALKSNALAAGKRGVQARNWRLIAAARDAAGDRKGAQQASQRAAALE